MTDQTVVPLAYGLTQAAQLAGPCSTRHLLREIRDKKLAAKKSGRRTLILHDELQRYLLSLPTRDSTAA